MFNYLFPNCIIDDFEAAKNKLILRAHSKTLKANCPVCHETSERVHSYYKRYPSDLPLADFQVEFCLRVKRFYCLNSGCVKMTFAESFEPWLSRYAHRSYRLSQKHSEVAVMLSAKASEVLLAKLQMPISHDTALNLIQDVIIPEYETPRVLGVDDFAIRKRKSYGTILLDLEKHVVIDVLADRSSATLIDWLEEHPGVEIISRDRSRDYKAACDKGAPEAIQVADRWHLLKNLSDTLKRWFERHKKHLLEPSSEQPISIEMQVLASIKTGSTHEQALKAKVDLRNKRIALFEEAKRLKADGFSLSVIARKLGMGKSTLYRWFSKHGFPDKQRERILEPFMPYLKERYEAGISNKIQLYREIISQGFAGSQAHVYIYFTELEAGLNPASKPKTAKMQALNPYTAYEATRMFTTPKEELSKRSELKLEQLFKSLKEAKACYLLAQRFIDLFKMQDKDADFTTQALEDWLKDTATSGISELVRFAKGLGNDKAAIGAALTLPWSNGMTEGKITKLKLIKRQMYGRANFDLLRKRILLAA